MTLSDYFALGDTCGLERLSDITTGNYRAVKGSQKCADPWRLDPDQSVFTETQFTTSTNRDIIYIGSSTIPIESSITFRTGFNTFSSSSDTERNEFGFSEDLVMVFVDSAGDSAQSSLGASVAVLLLVLSSLV